MKDQKIRLLVVDDSAVVRETVRQRLGQRPDWSVRVAADALLALERIREESPDVILLDLEMPRMGGLMFLRHIMATEPIPVVVCSGYAQHGTERAAAALELGAVDIFPKPELSLKAFLEDEDDTLAEVLRRASTARVGATFDRSSLLVNGPSARNGPSAQKGASEQNGSSARSGHALKSSVRASATGGGDGSGSRGEARTLVDGPWKRTVLLGASLGGPEAIRTVISGLPADAPPFVVVQHMLEEFTGAFVDRLDSRVSVEVRLAEDRSPLVAGRVLVAPGGVHVRVERVPGGRHRVRLIDAPPVRGHRPSVDVLFESAADALGEAAVAALLTGMGADGANGLCALRRAGAHTIVQDEETSVVFGMPAAALALDAAVETLPLSRIGPRLLALARIAPGIGRIGERASAPRSVR